MLKAILSGVLSVSLAFGMLGTAVDRYAYDMDAQKHCFIAVEKIVEPEYNNFTTYDYTLIYPDGTEPKKLTGFKS